MTDETDKRDGVASRMPLWALAILAAVAFRRIRLFHIGLLMSARDTRAAFS